MTEPVNLFIGWDQFHTQNFQGGTSQKRHPVCSVGFITFMDSYKANCAFKDVDQKDKKPGKPPLPEKRVDTWRSDLRSLQKIIFNWKNDHCHHFAFKFLISLSSKLQWKISILKERKKKYKFLAQKQCTKKGEICINLFLIDK